MDRAKRMQRQFKATRQQLKRVAADRSRPLAQVQMSWQKKLVLLVQRGSQRFSHSEVTSRAASVTYFGVLSLFPIFITVGNLLPLFNIKSTVVLRYLNEVVPPNISSWLQPTIRGLLTRSHGGILSIGAIATLWTASMTFNELKNGYNRIYHVRPKQNFLLKRLISMLLMVLVIFALAGVMLAFALGSQLLEWLVPTLGLGTEWLTAFNTWRLPVTVAAMVVAIGGIHYFLPSARIRFRSILPGTIFTVTTGLGLAQLFSLYVRYFGAKYNSYGTIGAVMVLMLWLDFSAMLLLIGAVINAETAEYYDGPISASEGRWRQWWSKRR